MSPPKWIAEDIMEILYKVIERISLRNLAQNTLWILQLK